MRRQCRQVESSLSEDFRVLAFLKSDLSPSKAKVLEEEVRALPEVADVQYLSSDSALSYLKERSPEMIQSVSVLGENPLDAVMEIRLLPDALPGLAQWIDNASKISELSDLRYKPLQAKAILQARFYRHFLELAMSLAALPWFLGAAMGLWSTCQGLASSDMLTVFLSRLAIAAVGALAGMGVIYAVIAPANSAILLLWPTLKSQIGLFMSGMAGGFWIGRPPAESPAPHKHGHHSSRAETLV